jgi:hypothetical protein
MRSLGAEVMANFSFFSSEGYGVSPTYVEQTLIKSLTTSVKLIEKAEEKNSTPGKRTLIESLNQSLKQITAAVYEPPVEAKNPEEHSSFQP